MREYFKYEGAISLKCFFDEMMDLRVYNKTTKLFYVLKMVEWVSFEESNRSKMVGVIITLVESEKIKEKKK